MWNVIVRRGTFASREEAARYAGLVQREFDPASVIGVKVEPSAGERHRRRHFSKRPHGRPDR